jgi:RNA polymerase sigma factor (sigma-70 family)
LFGRSLTRDPSRIPAGRFPETCGRAVSMNRVNRAHPARTTPLPETETTMSDHLPCVRRLSDAQRALLAHPGARRLVRHTVRTTLRRFPGADPSEIEALAHEALVLAALRYCPSGAQFATFAQARVAGHVMRAIASDARALMRWQPNRPGADPGRIRAMRRSGAPERWHRLAFDLFGHGAPRRDPESALIAEVEQRRLAAALNRALARLPSDDAHLLQRRYFDGVALPSLANEHDCSPRTVTRRLARILAQLRRDLIVSGIDELAPEALEAA